MRTDLARLLAFGTGVAIDVRQNELVVSIARVRPSGVSVLGSATVPAFRTRPAAEWGAELLAFLKKIGVGHVAATVLLPRREIILRQLTLPGVSDKDLAAAIQLQMDSLHPFQDDEVYFTYSRLGRTSAVLVGISRRETVDNYAALFAEAGIKVASFTFSAAAMYSALRLVTPAPAPGFLALIEREGELEAYGESEARPIYSTSLPAHPGRAAALAASELRLDATLEPQRVQELLPRPAVFPPNHDPESPDFETNALAYATALSGACPWLSLDANLLPASQRRASSRMRLIPTIGLASVLLVLTGALAAHGSFADKRYLGVLQHEISRHESRALQVDRLDKETAAARARAQMLDDFRRRVRLDMDAIAELTRIVPPPGWIQSLDMTRDTVQIAGEADQAAELLKALDGSAHFENSEFTMPIARGSGGDIFRLRAARQTPPVGGGK
jgi:Tfp pilus assembly protein PilN